ncbi:hypothetical protein PHYPO_G00204770 [Pangasianodon hypophthalmus]|uniref:Uncharacterized protein n=1 Tax=Pangasianodon hypophthalmus TaxID=310915 RepID=A0A5N5PDA8_PANHP|nr:hypothetical protein PHYPO_G00204770 [Pangasianodon hypophthalmus]
MAMAFTCLAYPIDLFSYLCSPVEENEQCSRTAGHEFPATRFYHILSFPFHRDTAHVCFMCCFGGDGGMFRCAFEECNSYYL